MKSLMPEPGRLFKMIEAETGLTRLLQWVCEGGVIAVNFGIMFELVSVYEPAGDQPEAIKKLTEGLKSGAAHQTLLGVTGSGKTFTVANVIRNINKPTLVISHNKTLAAQL